MKGTYPGLFFTSLAALMLEILLTRVFSVATWYYFAFFAISVAMFGFTVGALIVYLWKDYFPDEVLPRRLSMFAVLFGAATAVSLLVFLSIPFYPRLTGVGIFSTVLTYLVISLPFVCAGVVVCLCLTRFPKKVSLLYAADLAGAGIGAFMVFPVLNAMDAPTAILLTGAVGALGGVFFTKSPRATLSFLALTAFMLLNYLYQPVRVEWVKSRYNVPEFEVWNAFSRIAVYPLNLTKTPYSWGLSGRYERDRVIGERMIDIDGVSETVMTLYDGNPDSVSHLKYDVTHVAHYLKKDARVFVIGVGGGRDILAAKVFGQKEVVGAEINNRTIEVISGPFADFTGHLHELPGVTIIEDEARSAITRMDEKFDIIQASCIATWSATTAGAFTLAENSLYTIEAWRTFFEHLNEGGVLSFNRWYSPDYPAQLLRLASLASVTLKGFGIEDPGRHIVVVRNGMVGGRMPSGTILVKRTPFSEEDLKKLSSVAAELDFIFEYNPSGPRNPLFEEVINRAGSAEFHATTLLDLSPSTDDRPFFFHMLRLSDVFMGTKPKLREQAFNMKGIAMLVVLMVTTIALSILFIFGPLAIKRRIAPMPPRGGLVGLLFFASIGLGYILVEMSLLQRLIIFLGHPIYSITVVIFSMLLSSGIGAMTTSVWTGGSIRKTQIAAFMAVLLAMLLFTVYWQVGVLSAYEYGGIYTRIGVSLIFLIPLGFFMGMPFPFGMAVASRSFSEHTPWFWAINGAMSVVASVLSVCISIAWGFTSTLKAGTACYFLAAITLLLFHSVSRPRG